MSTEVTFTHPRIGGVNDSPSLGSANLSKDEVAQAIDALIKKMTPAYLELIAENSDTSKTRDTRIWNKNNGNYKDKIIVYPHIKQNKKLENENCLISVYIKIKDLQDMDALDHLLVKLRNRLFDLGYTDKSNTEFFYVVLEKGTLETEHSSSTSYWHRDGGFKTSIATCFSSIENWSTHVVDENRMPNETKDFINKSWTEDRRTFEMASNTISQSTLEKFGTPAKHGFLYDAMSLFHRAPQPSDIVGAGENDYRFFIRYEDHTH